MAKLVSIQQAARNVLATWLAGELAEVDDLEVEPRWAESDRELGKRITIIDAGPRDIEWMDPTIVGSSEVVGDVTKRDFVWNLGEITQRVQLDVWTTSDIARDDLIARLDGALNKGAKGLGLSNVDPFAAGLLLNLCDGWAPGNVGFLFEAPDLDDSATGAGESEWRATYRGRASAQMIQTARSAKLARVLMKTRLRERDPIDQAEPPVVTVITTTS